METNPKPKNILEGFIGEATRRKEEYYNRGIFNGVEGNAAYDISKNVAAKSPQVHDDFTLPATSPNDDLELQQALALSLQDINTRASDVHVVNENSLAPVVPPFMSTFSRVEVMDDVPSSLAEDDEDLTRAIEMSLSDTKVAAVSTKKTTADVVDLTGTSNGNSREIAASEAKSVPSEAAASIASRLAEKRRLVAEAALRRMTKK